MNARLSLGIPRKLRRGKHMSSAPCDALNLHHSAGSCTFKPTPRRAGGQKQENKKKQQQQNGFPPLKRIGAGQAARKRDVD